MADLSAVCATDILLGPEYSALTPSPSFTIPSVPLCMTIFLTLNKLDDSSRHKIDSTQLSYKPFTKVLVIPWKTISLVPHDPNAPDKNCILPPPHPCQIDNSVTTSPWTLSWPNTDFPTAEALQWLVTFFPNTRSIKSWKSECFTLLCKRENY